MTDDDERVAYLAGEEGVEVDDMTRADLDELMALLGDQTVWSEPGDHLEDAVVDAIAAEAASAPAGDPSAAIAAPPRRTRRSARRSWSGPRAALLAAAAVGVLAVAGLVISRGGDDDESFAISLTATDLLPDASGDAVLTRTRSGWRIELDAEGLPRLDGGRFYQAWLRSDDDVLVAIGTFNEGDDVVLWSGVTPLDFRTLTVTEEEADGDPGSSGRRVLVGNVVVDD